MLAQSIVTEGLKGVIAGMNPMDLKRGIDQAVEAAVKEIGELSVPCTDSSAIAQVGTISANGDKRIGRSSPTHGEGRQGRRHHRR